MDIKQSNEEIILRAMEPSDIDLLYQWENDMALWFISNTKTPYSRHTLKQYIENSHRDIYENKQLRLMIDVKNSQSDSSSNATVGAIDLFDFDPYNRRAGVGILIYNKSHRRKGYARQALDLLIDYSFNVLGLHQLFCNISSDNQKSINLFSQAGFKTIGEKREWLKTPNGWLSEFMLQLIAR